MANSAKKATKKASNKAYDDAMMKHQEQYKEGMRGTYKLYTCHSGSSGTFFGVESCCGLFLITFAAIMTCSFSMEASELPYQVNDINVFLEYNRGEQDLQAIEILQNIETISVCASIMGGVIMGLSAMLWYCSHHLTRTYRYNLGVSLTFLMFATSWGLGWYVLIGSINNVYDRCHSHNPTITDVQNPSYSYEGYRYLCKDGNNRIGTGNAFNVLLLIMTPIYFLSNWCGKIFKPKMCCKGVQSNFMETAAEFDLDERAHLTHEQ